ncbi:MAG: hypothetical protein N4A41_05105 [Crocinitomicaceae bacterium]|nr:hypothetical protein [Crocinitomicaceae bacterium]
MKFRIVIHSLLALFVFAGTTGVYVFEHICQIDGHSTSLYIHPDHPCQEQRKSAHHEVSHGHCSKMETSSELGFNKDCCSDEIQVFQVNYDYYQNWHVALPHFVASIEPMLWSNTIRVLMHQRTTLSQFNRPPPLVTGRQISILHQVFLC